MGAVFSAMKAEYVVVAEQAHPLGPAYSLPTKYNVGSGYADYIEVLVKPCCSRARGILQ